MTIGKAFRPLLVIAMVASTLFAVLASSQDQASANCYSYNGISISEYTTYAYAPSGGWYPAIAAHEDPQNTCDWDNKYRTNLKHYTSGNGAAFYIQLWNGTTSCSVGNLGQGNCSFMGGLPDQWDQQVCTKQNGNNLHCSGWMLNNAA